jgi:glycosyltransferase involved in cell wall biosynthesis
VLLISFSRQYPQWLFPGKTDKDPSLEPQSVEDTHYWLDSLNPLTWISTFAAIRRSAPEAIVMQWWTTFWAPAWFVLGILNRILLRVPMVCFCHNVLPHETRPWDRWLAKLVLRQSLAFIVQSAAEKTQLLSLIPGAQVQISCLPTFDMLANQRVSRSLARQQLGLAPDLPVLLFFGIVREYKGLEDLLQALPAVKERLGQVLLIIAGEFWENKQPYLDEIRRMGVGDSVLVDDRYIPNEVAAVYFSAADLLVAPYRQVTGSAVIPTARAYRLPVVATELPAIVQALNGQPGQLVPPRDPDALATAITETLAGNAQSKPPADPFREAFTWDQLVAVIEASVQGALP